MLGFQQGLLSFVFILEEFSIIFDSTAIIYLLFLGPINSLMLADSSTLLSSILLHSERTSQICVHISSSVFCISLLFCPYSLHFNCYTFHFFVNPVFLPLILLSFQDNILTTFKTYTYNISLQKISSKLGPTFELILLYFRILHKACIY